MQLFALKPGVREGWCVAALALAALLVRIPPALIPHFWYDEIYTIAIIQAPSDLLLRITAGDAHPPLYYFWVKAFAVAGRFLGGPCTTLAWLRLASILPGWLTCLLAWGLARCRWGRRVAFWTLGLFAFSPALAYYSVELRNYSLTHCLLLAALIGLLEITDPVSRRPWRGVWLFALAAIAALYTHSLANLYLTACGAIFVVELLLARGGRRILLGRGAMAFGLVALCYLPWVPVLLRQTAWLNRQQLDWLPWAERWRDLAVTLLWYLPLGPLHLVRSGAWQVAAMAWVGAGLALLWASTCLGRRSSRPDRLLLYAATLALMPVTEAFLLSHYHHAKIFLGYRYNLLAAPFFTLMGLGLLRALPRPRLRGALLAGVLAASATSAGWLLWQKPLVQNDLARMAQWRDSGIVNPASRLAWTNPVALPWLARCGPLRLDSFEDVLTGRAPASDGGSYYFFSHQILGVGSAFSQTPGLVLEALLEQRKTPRVNLAGFWEWRGAWRLEPRELPTLAAAWAAACHTIENRRTAIPGGQVLLAGDPDFGGSGWTPPEVNRQLMVQCWTEGPRQILDWPGPAMPGRYSVRLTFVRGHPFPEKETTLRYRLPGQAAWTERRVGLGTISLVSEVEVTTARQPLRLELATPCWRPSECLPGSLDRRLLGMTFISMELRPVSL